MNFGWGMGNFIAISGLAIRVYIAYKDAPDDYRRIPDKVLALRALNDIATRDLKHTAISSDDHCAGQKVLEDCQNVLESLNSPVEKYKSLASKNERLAARAKLCKDGIITLQERLISNTVLLYDFFGRFVPDILGYQSHGY